jgi:hypothetical protein
VSEERIALALDVDVAGIRQKRALLDGICPEAVQLLRDRKATAAALRELRKVRPLRQVEVAELMCSTNNYSVGYARCLVATTPVEFQVDSERAREAHGLSPRGVARQDGDAAGARRGLPAPAAGQPARAALPGPALPRDTGRVPEVGRAKGDRGRRGGEAGEPPKKRLAAVFR